MVVLEARGEPTGQVNYLEYIQSTGTQWIDTGFKPNQDTRVVIDIAVSNTQIAEGHMCSVAEVTRFYSLFFQPKKTGWYHTRYGGGGVRSFSSGFKDKNRYTIDKNKNVTTIDGVDVIESDYTFQLENTLPIFCRNKSGTINNLIQASLYSFQLYDNGTLIRNFWPAKDENGVVCLYDKVSNQYFYNAGTGVFGAGPEL